SSPSSSSSSYQSGSPPRVLHLIRLSAPLTFRTVCRRYRFLDFDFAAVGGGGFTGAFAAFAAAGGSSTDLATRAPLVAAAGVVASAGLPLSIDAISARTSAGAIPTMVAVRV